jgi:type II secretory pathway pseudopilin PulG
MTNDERISGRAVHHSDFVTHSSFVIRHSSFRRATAFTVLELLVVIAIIIVLAGLILATTGYVQNKGARSRAEAEIAAMSAALESYKADNGIYPRNGDTDTLDPTDQTSTDYLKASQYVYGEVMGDRDFDGQTDSNVRSYMSFKPASLLRSDMSIPPSGSNKVTAIRDPFGNSYGYSTIHQADVEAAKPSPRGYNPTFDLWSIGSPSGGGWVKNW